MSGRSRSLVAAGVGVALLGLAGCGPGGLAGDESEGASGETSGAKPSGEVLAGVDPCGVLSDGELKSFGLELPGEPVSQLPWKPGCDYQGEPIGARFVKNERQTVASAAVKDTWAEFERTEVKGRSGARVITKGATQARSCGVLFDSGGRSIEITATETRLPDEVDECAKALEIAEKVESNVPELA